MTIKIQSASVHLAMASLQKKHGSWYGVFSYGKRKKWRSLGIPDSVSRTEARKILSKMELEFAQGTFDLFKPKPLAFAAFADIYWQRRLPNISANTAQVDKFRIEILKDYWKSTPIENIYLADIEELKGWLFKRGLKSKTINNYIGLVNNMFRRAVEWKYLSRPPWTQSPKLKVRDAKPRRFLTLDEIERLIAASKESRNKRLYYFVMIAVYTGMRLGEIMTLEWQQIDFESKLIHIINKPDKGFTTKSLKERSIGIHPRLYEALQEFFLKRHELVSYPGQARQKDHNYLFPSPYRAGKKQFPYRCAFWQAMARAKIENASLHSLRHTFASQLLMNGGNLKDCQEILGHRDISTTANIYAHLSPERKIDIISKLPY